MRLTSQIIFYACIASCCAAVDCLAQVAKQVESASISQDINENVKSKMAVETFLPSVDGHSIAVIDQTSPWTVICFFATECPLSRFYMKRLETMSSGWDRQQIRLVGVSSSDQDSMDDLKRFRDELKLSFPIVKDYDQALAKQLGATRNPHAFVVDQQGEARYQGRIDDQYMPGFVREAAKSHELQDALDALLTGRSDYAFKTEPFGCKITYRKQTETDQSITYTSHIQPILQKRCVECHRPGEIGPFSLTDYAEIVGWGEMMVEVIDQYRMPPWHADDSVHFTNARGMPEDEKQMMRRWVASGMPYGNHDENNIAAITQAPISKKEPDLRLQMSQKPFVVPAAGTVDYQYFVVDPQFTEDRWIRLANVLPGNRSVVHHIIVFVRPPDDEDFRNIGMLGAYVPGQATPELPDGYAQRVRAGSRFVFQMHYTPNGTIQEDVSSLELYFADSAQVTHQVFSVAGLQQDFEIPPYAANHQVSGTVHSMPNSGKLLSVSPHMHVRGKSFQVSAQTASGQRPMLNVPHYDFNWQHNYIYAEPIDLSEVSEVHFSASFDNSSQNFVNPDPSQYVLWGDQTWEEMAVVFFAVAQPLQTANVDANRLIKSTSKVITSDEQSRTEHLAAVQRRVQERLQALDKNRDDRISKSEASSEFIFHVFPEADVNHDQAIDRDELTRYIEMAL